MQFCRTQYFKEWQSVFLSQEFFKIVFVLSSSYTVSVSQLISICHVTISILSYTVSLDYTRFVWNTIIIQAPKVSSPHLKNVETW